ncbi:methyltransferase [Zeaxanthinibacter enoshimensis]|uniref:Methyltransferase family protein n=1 Tax=Zeaxanthinibacter enoshimensis TaxID=392009 RepID=A0A4R6TMS5_9FLAO|nr:methyltransferase [Zeaxanthinibacter enoshimensis]TDQ29391.1 methyltransferase family protein [Zeaxanthinibacter enoshimensis]
MKVLTKKKAETRQAPNPAKIMETGMAFWASKVLLTAVKLELFTYLSKGKVPAHKIQKKLHLHPRAVYDFLDALVSLGFLEREGLKENALYSNTADTDAFLDKHKRSYIGGMLEMANNRLYPFWVHLEQALKTGDPQNETAQGEKPFFETLYEDEDRLREFVSAMGGFQMGNFMAFCNRFDFSNYNTFCDIGGAGGFLSAQVAIQHPHMKCITFDLPKVARIAKENMERIDCLPRVEVRAGDFFKDDFPKADIIAMGNILHDWGIADKKLLIRKAYDALPEGGAFVAIENVIDNQRRKNSFGLLMSLNMLIETADGADYTEEDFTRWTREAGFRKTTLIPLTGPSSAAIAYK